MNCPLHFGIFYLLPLSRFFFAVCVSQAADVRAWKSYFDGATGNSWCLNGDTAHSFGPAISEAKYDAWKRLVIRVWTLLCEKKRVNEANLVRVILLTREVSLEMSRDLAKGQLAALVERLMGPGGDFNVEVPGAITNLGEPAIGAAAAERAKERAAAAKQEVERVRAELAEHAAAAKREAERVAAADAVRAAEREAKKRCSEPDCDKPAASGGILNKCIAHGGGKRRTEPGCAKSAVSGDSGKCEGKRPCR